MIAESARARPSSYGFYVYYDWPLALCVIVTVATWYAVSTMMLDPGIMRRVTSDLFVLISFIVGMTFLLGFGPLGCFLYSQRLKVGAAELTVWKFMRRPKSFRFADIEKAVLYPDRTGIGVRLILSDGQKLVVMPTARNLDMLRDALNQRLLPDRIEQDW